MYFCNTACLWARQMSRLRDSHGRERVSHDFSLVCLLPCRRSALRVYSPVVQLTQKPRRKPPGYTSLYEEIADPVEEWDRVRACETLLQCPQFSHAPAASQGIDQGVFLGVRDQHLC